MHAELGSQDWTHTSAHRPAISTRYLCLRRYSLRHRSDSDPTKLIEMVLCICLPSHRHLQFVSAVSVAWCFLIQLDVNSKERARLLGIMHLTVIKMFPWSFTEKQNCCPLSDVHTFHTCNMSKVILWLNPGKNAKNAWLEAYFSSKNTTWLINCSTWRRLFNMKCIFFSSRPKTCVRIYVFFGFRHQFDWLH